MLASSSDHLLGQIVNSTETDVQFRAHDDTSIPIHVVLMLQKGPGSEIVVKLESVQREKNGDEEGTKMKVKRSRESLSEIALTRKSLPDFFLFDYEHLGGNTSKPAPMNISADTLSVMRFKVGPVYDTGGTLSVGLKIADDYERPDKNSTLVIVGCLNYGYFARIRPDGRCQRNSKTKSDPPDLYVNSKSAPSFVHAPFPEPGLWHLSTKAFCISSTGCECFESCIRPNATSTNSTSCKLDKLSNMTLSSTCNCAWECPARIESSIASSPCIEGGCGEHGRCMHHMSGGFVFSACYCNSGYRGFDCADDAYVTSRARALATLLMLTLSNLAFLGAIFVAVTRGYYTEAVVYTAVMIFSSSYHACEAGIDVFNFEKEHSLCLTRLNVLQFCDFFNALLSIWVTLVAMASMGPRATSFAHMLGVVVLAVGAELDKTALWVFLMPVVCGCSLVVISWAYKCRQKGTLKYPARIYRLVYLPIGLTVVLIGMICYAFLQTRRNYYILHSLWHVCVATGVVLLLPKRHYME
ncbi:hypothetical protein QAD02_005614 [Eretmocerus hayati]|uniref:Uncharacterized protein n=1 Tax=Eretmocerus hayati TaxID=131215 RepID=A0ACC2NVW2_9HYME|nr:hypothetical protein QAD02_005614 [Eretmocerus hayati]